MRHVHIMPHLGHWDICRDGSPNVPFTTKADAVHASWTAACAERVDLYVHRLDGTMHRYLSRVDGTNPERDEE